MNVTAASAYGSIIPAAWSFQLALRSRGLGSVWTTLHLLQERRASPSCSGIPEGVTQVGAASRSPTRSATDFKPAARPPVEEITSWNTWGSS